MVDSVVSMSVVMQTPDQVVQPSSSSAASVFDLAHFDAHYRQATPVEAVTPVVRSPSGGGFTAAVRALDALNSGATDLGDKAVSLAADLQALTPGDMLHLTVQAHHFVFQSQLTANVANRTSEGIQQLFRQQS